MLKRTLSQITTHNIVHNLFVPRKWLAAACAVVMLFASAQPLLAAANSETRAPAITRISLTEMSPGNPNAGFLVSVEGKNLCDGDTPVAENLQLQVEGSDVRTVDHTVCTPDHGLNQPTGGIKRFAGSTLEGDGFFELETKEGFATKRSLHITALCSNTSSCLYVVKLTD